MSVYADQLKAFKVLNSWGTKWGNGGYAWIDYSTFQNLTLEGYVTIDIFLDRVASAAVPVSASSPSGDRISKGSTADLGLPGGTPRDVKPVPEEATPSTPTTAARREQTPSPAVPVPTPTVSPSPVPGKLTVATFTPQALSAAVRSTTEPKGTFQWNGYSVQPYSVWLELPEAISIAVQRTEYWFNHPSFTNPKNSIAGSNIFIAKWQGYGCINDAKVIAFMKDGRKIEAPFDLCAAQGRF